MSIEWVPLAVTTISIVGAVLTYSYQRRVDRKSALIEMRRNSYRNYLHALIAMSDDPDNFSEVRRRHYQSEVELLVIGSDPVVQCVGKLSRYFADTNNDRSVRDMNEIAMLVAEICRAMRFDCFEKTDLSLNEIQALVPIA